MCFLYFFAISRINAKNKSIWPEQVSLNVRWLGTGKDLLKIKTFNALHHSRGHIWLGHTAGRKFKPASLFPFWKGLKYQFAYFFAIKTSPIKYLSNKKVAAWQCMQVPPFVQNHCLRHCIQQPGIYLGDTTNELLPCTAEYSCNVLQVPLGVCTAPLEEIRQVFIDFFPSIQMCQL